MWAEASFRMFGPNRSILLASSTDLATLLFAVTSADPPPSPATFADVLRPSGQKWPDAEQTIGGPTQAVPTHALQCATPRDIRVGPFGHNA